MSCLCHDPLAAALIGDGIDEDAAYDIVERAAIMTFDGQVPAREAELIATGGYAPGGAP